MKELRMWEGNRMARKQSKQSHKADDGFVQVDVYMLPAPVAEMYRVLREAVATEMMEVLQHHYPMVTREPDAIEGESIVAYDTALQEQWRYYLSPTNLSYAQKARDKEHFDKYLANLGIPIE